MSYVRYKFSCVNCKQQISVNNFNNHLDSKACSTPPKEQTVVNGSCKFCSEDLSNANSGAHVKWCTKNPNRGQGAVHKAVQLNTPAAILKRAEKITAAHADGRYVESQVRARGKHKEPHSETSKKLMSERALASKHQRVCKLTHDFVDKRGRTFRFDSKWEDAFAERLDDIDVLWNRPEPIQYELGGRVRNYFPDFYLPEFDLYVDPKNPYALNQQREKIDTLLNVNKLRLVILTSLELCKNWTPLEESNLEPSILR